MGASGQGKDDAEEALVFCGGFYFLRLAERFFRRRGRRCGRGGFEKHTDMEALTRMLPAFA